MAEFSVKTNVAKTTVDAEERLKRELRDIQWSIREISGSLAIRTSAAPGIKTRLGRAAGRVEDHRKSMESMKNALEEAMGLYKKTEQDICGNTGGGIRAEAKLRVAGSSIWDCIADFFGEIIGGLFSPIITAWFKIVAFIKGAIGKGDVTEEQPTADWADQITAGAEGEMTASGAPRYNQPDYAKQGLDPVPDRIYGNMVYRRNSGPGSVCYWNRPGELSCTYYTLRKLNEKGLSYPCISDSDGRGPRHGGEWYNHFDTESGLPHFGGDNALYDLTNTLELPQENIVVSFESGPPLEDGTITGHVLLIDRMYKDENGIVQIEYSDNYPPISSLNGYNKTRTETLETFKNRYYKSNGNISGAAVIGAGYR